MSLSSNLAVDMSAHLSISPLGVSCSADSWYLTIPVKGRGNPFRPSIWSIRSNLVDPPDGIDTNDMLARV